MMTPFTTTTRMLYELSFLFKFLFPLENNRIVTTFLTKENTQSILECHTIVPIDYCGLVFSTSLTFEKSE